MLFLLRCIQLQQLPAPSLVGATKYSLPCLDTIEEVSEEDFCIICHMSVWRNPPQNDVVAAGWRKHSVDLRSFEMGGLVNFLCFVDF